MGVTSSLSEKTRCAEMGGPDFQSGRKCCKRSDRPE